MSSIEPGPERAPSLAVLRSRRCGHVLGATAVEHRTRLVLVRLNLAGRVRGLEVVDLAGDDLTTALAALIRHDQCARCTLRPSKG